MGTLAIHKMAKAAGAAAQSKGGAAKKKKWSKGKVKDKANNAVVCDKPTFDRIMKEVPTFKMISQSVLISHEDQRIPRPRRDPAPPQGGPHQAGHPPPRPARLHPRDRRGRRLNRYRLGSRLPPS